MIHETPIMKLCDRVRNAFSGMELSLRRATSSVYGENEAQAISDLMRLSGHCRDVISAVDDFCIEIDRRECLK